MSHGGGAAELVDRLAAVITVTGGRRGGDAETRVELDHLMPSPDDLGSGRLAGVSRRVSGISTRRPFRASRFGRGIPLTERRAVGCLQRTSRPGSASLLFSAGTSSRAGVGRTS